MPQFRLFLFTLLLLGSAPGFTGLAAQEAPTTGYSGLPVPRFVNLKANETWGRIGPSFDYPVRFVFQRKGLPVRVIAETRDNNWRKVVDHEGESMWIHQSQLVTSRDVLINRDGGVTLRAGPKPEAKIRATLQQGVLARLEECDRRWCLVTVQHFRGWVPQNALWGVD